MTVSTGGRGSHPGGGAVEPDPLPDAAIHPSLNRRALLAAGSVAGATAVVAVVSGCATYSSGGAPASAPPAEPAQTGEPGTGHKSPGESQAAPAGVVLGPASAVPVGGGAVFADQSVVVTQPTPGVFRAFSAVCTHEGCTVSDVYGGTINCPCHGSKFAITDGSVASGPARRALPAKRVNSDRGQLTVS